MRLRMMDVDRHRGVRRVLVGSAALTLTLSLLGGSPTTSFASVHAVCGISSNDFVALHTCYTPAKVGIAERQLPTSPVRPNQIVRQFLPLRLTHVEIRRMGGAVQIQYLFGSLPADRAGFPDIAGPHPAYILVSEGTGTSPVRHPKLVRTVNPAGPAQAKNEVYWQYWANFRCHSLQLLITSNQQGKVVRSIGRGILNQEVCGK